MCRILASILIGILACGRVHAMSASPDEQSLKMRAMSITTEEFQEAVNKIYGMSTIPIPGELRGVELYGMSGMPIDEWNREKIIAFIKSPAGHISFLPLPGNEEPEVLINVGNGEYPDKLIILADQTEDQDRQREQLEDIARVQDGRLMVDIEKLKAGRGNREVEEAQENQINEQMERLGLSAEQRLKAWYEIGGAEYSGNTEGTIAIDFQIKEVDEKWLEGLVREQDGLLMVDIEKLKTGWGNWEVKNAQRNRLNEQMRQLGLSEEQMEKALCEIDEAEFSGNEEGIILIAVDKN